MDIYGILVRHAIYFLIFWHFVFAFYDLHLAIYFVRLIGSFNENGQRLYPWQKWWDFMPPVVEGL